MSTEAEWLTRKSRIDNRLKQKGWQLVRFSPALDLKALDRTVVEELPTANGPADYALFVKGQLLGIIEAKKVTVNPQNVLEQAKRYAAGVFDAAGEWNGYRVPFLYASNGTLIWHVDTRPDKLIARTISDFHTPDALESRFAHDTAAARSYLLDTPTEQIGRLRPYQRDCILAVEQAIMSGKHDMMVAMATGTGKTYLTVAQVYRLLESKLVRCILFSSTGKLSLLKRCVSSMLLTRRREISLLRSMKSTASDFRGKILATTRHSIQKFFLTNTSQLRRQLVHSFTSRPSNEWLGICSARKLLSVKSAAMPI